MYGLIPDLLKSLSSSLELLFLVGFFGFTVGSSCLLSKSTGDSSRSVSGSLSFPRDMGGGSEEAAASSGGSSVALLSGSDCSLGGLLVVLLT